MRGSILFYKYNFKYKLIFYIILEYNIKFCYFYINWQISYRQTNSSEPHKMCLLNNHAL